jgi:anti-sigma factor RsiW
MKRCEEIVPLLGPLADGALPKDGSARVQDHLRGCAACRDRMALIAAQGDALREALAARAAQANFDGLADRVLAKAAAQPHRAPLPVWFSELWSVHRGAFAAAGGLAAAAAVALAVLYAPPPALDEPGLLADARGPEIQEVEFGTHDGAVLQLSPETTVIWMSDDRGAQQ